jgi:methionine synthase I (cobalamin-dependent)
MMVEAVTTALGDVARGVPQLGVRLGCSIDQRDAAARQWLLDVAKGVPEQIQFGVNCAAGPADMVEVLRGLVEIRGAAWWAPSAGEPVGDPPSWPYDSGNEWASIVAQQIGAVNATEAQQIVVGGCCGTTPKHIAALVELLHNS